MENNKNNNKANLIAGAVLTVLGIIAMCLTRGAAILEEATNTSKSLYSVSIVLVIIGVIVLISGIVPAQKKIDAKQLAAAAIMAALCYVGFAFFKIDIPVPGSMEKTAFHLGNVFCVLAALFIGGLWGGLAGAVGMTIGDLLTGYITSAPKTFLLKLCIGLITGLVAHKVLKIDREKNKGKLTWKTVVAAAAGMAFNVVADPIVGYFYKRYLFGLPQDLSKALAKISAVTTLVNAIVAVVVASIFYLALRPALRKIGFLGVEKKAE